LSEKDLAGNTLECRSLLKDLLKIDPVKRLSACEALKHPWFRTNIITNPIDKSYALGCFKYFMMFSPDQKFQQAAIAYMVHHLTDIDEINEIRKIFETFDTNHDGKLSHSEIFEGFKNIISVLPNEKEFLKLIKKIDSSKTGFIEYEGIHKSG
jgi:calcium-dependent protein kinase